MKRGSLVLAVLMRVDDPQYGYTLITELSELGMTVEQNTLYPLMRRIEKQGLLQSLWQIEENRPRRYYQINTLGREVRTALIAEWRLYDYLEEKFEKKDYTNNESYIVPDSFTHGTSQQRKRWFNKGYEAGDLSEWDTFSADEL